MSLADLFRSKLNHYSNFMKLYYPKVGLFYHKKVYFK